LYLIFALFSGLVGTAFSVLIRLELAGPGVQYIGDNQLYNSIITAHAILMIFFMVEKQIFILNMKSQPSLDIGIVNNSDNNDVVITGNNNNNNDGNKNSKKSKHKYVKVLVGDPFNYRDIILKVTKKQKEKPSPNSLNPNWVTGFSDASYKFLYNLKYLFVNL
jgi:hypothetical protein